MDEISNAKASVLREFAEVLDGYAGTVLNASSAAEMARGWAEELSQIPS